jgi:hypothetical protein
LFGRQPDTFGAIWETRTKLNHSHGAARLSPLDTACIGPLTNGALARLVV